MSTIIEAKFNREPLPDYFISRLRLQEQLKAILEVRLTLVVAPAGFGKTCAIIDWCEKAEESAVQVAWISLDERDKYIDLTTFWEYILAALEKINSEAVKAIPESVRVSESEMMIVRLINALGALGKEFIFVLDQFQFIDSEDIQQAISFLLTHLPRHMHIIISTRNKPEELPLASMRARAQLVEFSENDLRFTDEEAASFFSRTLPLPPEMRLASLLNKNIAGWVTGLMLATYHIKRSADIETGFRTFNLDHQYIRDYLWEEVIRKLPKKLQDFLLYTCILSTMNNKLCASVTLFTDSANILKQINGLSLFLIPLEGEWYRYHSYIGEMLQERIKTKHTDILPALHQRAARWYAANNALIKAIPHALEAEDFPLSAELLEKYAQETLHRMKNSDMIRLITFIEQLPKDVLMSHPYLLLDYIFSSIIIDPLILPIADIEKDLRILEINIREEFSLQEKQYINMVVLTIKAYLRVLTGDVASATLFVNQVKELVTQLNHDSITAGLDLDPYLIKEFKHIKAFSILLLICVSAVLGDRSSVYKIAELINDNQANQDDHLHNIIMGCVRAHGQWYIDRPRAIQNYLELQIAADQYNWLLSVAVSYLTLPEIFNEMTNTPEQLRKCISLIEKLVPIAATVIAHIVLVRQEEINGYPNGNIAGITLRKLEEILNENGIKALDPIESALMPFLLVHGRMLTVVELVGQLDEVSVDDEENNDIREIFYLTLLRIVTVISAPDEAYEKNMRFSDEILWMSGKLSGVIHTLANLQLKNHLASIFGIHWMSYKVMESDRFAVPSRISIPSTFSILARLKIAEISFQPGVIIAAPEKKQLPSPHDAQPGPLSERELEVLDLLQVTTSSHKIALKLNISENTVKKHRDHIYKKLGVINQYEALARARELNILPPKSPGSAS